VVVASVAVAAGPVEFEVAESDVAESVGSTVVVFDGKGSATTFGMQRGV